MRFEEFRIGMICEISSGAKEHYEIIGLNPSNKTIDIKCVACDNKEYIGHTWKGWAHYSTWKPVSMPNTGTGSLLNVAPISAINIAKELESTAKHLDELDAGVDDILNQLYGKATIVLH